MNAATRDKAYRVAKEIMGDGAHSGGVLDLLAGGLVAERETVDPLFAEIDDAVKSIDMESIGGAGGVVDEMRNELNDIDDGESDEDWFAAHRAAFVKMAALGLAGIRAIDRH